MPLLLYYKAMTSIAKIRASDGTGNASVATVQSARSGGATTIIVDTVLGINAAGFMASMGTPHTFTDPVTGEEITVISEATAVDFEGHVDGSNLEIDAIAPGYTDNGSEVGDIVIIRPTTQWSDNVADVLDVALNDDGSLKAVVANQAWTTLPNTPDTVTYNGNGNYTEVYNGVDLTSVIAPGMRLKHTRASTAPTQCTSLNGTNQSWSKTGTITGLSTGANWTFRIKVKLNSYKVQVLAAFDDGATNILQIYTNASGQLLMSGGTYAATDIVTSYATHPLNEWFEVTGNLQLGSATGVMTINGETTPTFYTNSAATTFTAASTTFYVGRNAAGNYVDGKISQVGIFNTTVTPSTLRGYYSQVQTGAETNCIGFWSFNGNGNDSTTNANNLTANNSATATNADAPFSVNSFGTATGSTDFGIVQTATFSTNTTVVVQVPSANAIPTTASGVSAVAYSTSNGYGFPSDETRWEIGPTWIAAIATTATAGTVTGTFHQFVIPIGKVKISYAVDLSTNAGAPQALGSVSSISSSATAHTPIRYKLKDFGYITSASDLHMKHGKSDTYTATTATTAYLAISPYTTCSNFSAQHGFSTGYVSIINAWL